ncbi:Hypothetical protein CINCED_3A016108 [Cinara cedri]|uniref:Uncharacterized protein n=1 Tax=Cinara cedri TaxID=506608 RepID=A0A5E4N8C7_9HEMI|nr:Hypothetical protein CINCED_3A016108 [Cinara cedri]
MSPFGMIVLTAASMAMLSAQVTMQTVNQTKKPRCVSIRPIPQPERQQPSSWSVSRSLSSPPKSPSASDLKSSSSPSGSKSSVTGPRSPVAVGPKTTFSSRSKSQSNRPVPMSSASPKPPFSSRSKSQSNRPVPMSSASPKSPFSSRSKSRLNGKSPLSSSGSRSPPDSVRSKPSRRKSPNSVQGSSNPSSPDSRMIHPSDSFSLFKLPLQLISNIFMPPTIKQNTSSVVSPLINFQMPLTFSTIHAAPYQVPCKKITNSPTSYGNPEPRTCADISTGPCSDSPPPAVPCSNPPSPAVPCNNPPPPAVPCNNPPPPAGPCNNPSPPAGPCNNPSPPGGPCSNPPPPTGPCSNPPPPSVPCNNPTTAGNTDHPTPNCVPHTQSSNGFLFYNFLCNLLFHKTISFFPPAVITTPTVDVVKNETTISCITPTTSESPIETITTAETPTEGPTETTTAPSVTPTTLGDEVTPAIDHNGTSCRPDTTLTSTQTPPVDVDVVCKVITCTPILRYIITKHLVCKSSLLSTCYFNKPVKKHWHSHQPVINRHPNTFHDARNDYATASDDSTLDNKQAELILKLIKILLSSSNN